MFFPGMPFDPPPADDRPTPLWQEREAVEHLRRVLAARQAEPEETTLVVFPVEDPLCRQGLPARPPEYRLRLALKALLRSYGLDAKVVRVPTAAELLHAADWL